MTNLEKAKQISCESILGTDFVKKGSKKFYYSPWRNESNRSLVVYPNNRWVDMGEDMKTRDSIDLYCKIHNVSISQAIKDMLGSDFKVAEKKNVEIEPGVIIHKISEISDKRLISYLSSRKISLETAKHYCKELIVSFPLSKNPSRRSMVIGFQNDRGGWEMRSEYIKLSNSPKCFTRLQKGSKHCVVVEGFFDLLSLLEMQKTIEIEQDIFVYNSTSFLSQSIPILKRYSAVYLFVDNDDAGVKVRNTLKENGVWVKDYSWKYEGYNDVNEFFSNKA